MKRDSLLSVVTEPCLFPQIPPSNQLQGSEAGKKPVGCLLSKHRPLHNPRHLAEAPGP